MRAELSAASLSRFELAAELRCRRGKRPRGGKSNGEAVSALLVVCIFGCYVLLVVSANHIHQLDSNTQLGDGSISANPWQQKHNDEKKSPPDMERIEVRPNFTFRVNGRELSLQATGKLSRGDISKKEISRVGDSSPVDYESGFEASDSDQQLDAPTGSHSSALMSSSPSASYSSSSSSSSSYSSPASNRQNSINDSSNSISQEKDKDLEDFDRGADSSSSIKWRNFERAQLLHRNSKQSGGGDDDNKQNRIISDWPKSVGREHSSAADRHSSWSQNNNGSSHQNKRESNSLSPKYSALLSSRAEANELAGQSGEPNRNQGNRRDDRKQLLTSGEQPLTGRIKLTISSGLAQTIKPPSPPPQTTTATATTTTTTTAVRKDEEDVPQVTVARMSSIGKTAKRGSSGRRRQTMRAPVHARQRNSFRNDADHNSTQTHERGAQNDASRSGVDTTTKLSPSQSHNGNSELRDGGGGGGSLNSTKKESKATSYDVIPAISISEQKTNFSSMFVSVSDSNLNSNSRASENDAGKGTAQRQALVDSSNKRPTGNSTVKSNIVQRDLSRVVHSPADSGRAPVAPALFRSKNDVHPAAGIQILASGSRANTTNDQLSVGQDLLQRLDLMESTRGSLGGFGRSEERIGVRTGPILTHPFGVSHANQLSALVVPAAMALLAQAQREDQHSQQSAALRMLQQQQQQQQPSFGWLRSLKDGATAAAAASARSGSTVSPMTSNAPNESQLFGVDQMIATANHLGVAHLGPVAGGQAASGNLGTSETNSYGSMADYTADRAAAEASLQSNYEPNNSAGSDLAASQSPAAAPASNMSGDEQRFAYPNEYPNESDHNLVRSHQGDPQATTNSRSSMSDTAYLRSEHKTPIRDVSSAGYSSQVRGSIDPFEELAGSALSASDYERDLADLDEEFSRHTAHRRPTSPLMGESYLSLSPERYEARRFNRRPPSYGADYGSAASEYLSTANSMSSIIPRTYPRSPWPNGSPYSESSDLWSDTSVDYTPLMSPSHYAYRWRPRYQRITGYPGASFLAAAASEHQLQPGYSIPMPSYSPTSNLQPTTETISFALSPLAAAAAAAASALAAADKSRHPSHAWLTLPRLTAAATPSNQQSSLSSSSPTTSASTVPTTIPAAAYLASRPGPFAFSPIPIYAFAPRPPTSPGLAGTASAAAPAMIPYFHGATPTLLAYRTAGMIPGSSLLTAASYAYPFRLPITAATMARPPIPLTPTSGGRSLSSNNRPYLTDLQLAETKNRSNNNNNNNNMNNNSNLDTKSGFAKSSSTLTAMAKNLSKKVFGSASQLRPQHVAPPTLNSGYELLGTSAPTTALSNLSQSIIK